MMMIVAINTQVRIKNLRMIDTLLQAALKVRKPKVLLTLIDLLKGHQLNEKKQEEKFDTNRDLIQKTVTIHEKRQNCETKSADQFDNYGKYIACQLIGIPEKDCEYVQYKIQKIIFQVKSCSINYSFQTANPIFPAVHLQDFSAPNQTIQRQKQLEELQPLKIPGGFKDYLNSNNL